MGVFLLIKPLSKPTVLTGVFVTPYFRTLYLMLEEFIKHKSEILTVIENIETLTKEDAEAIDDRLLTVKEHLLSNCFNLVILGQFKRGKTTLINSLIGKEILPSSVVPLTSVVTILKHQMKLTVIFICRTAVKKCSPGRTYRLHNGKRKSQKYQKCALRTHSISIPFP